MYQIQIVYRTRRILYPELLRDLVLGVDDELELLQKLPRSFCLNGKVPVIR